jgi:hypothetical protein
MKPIRHAVLSACKNRSRLMRIGEYRLYLRLAIDHNELERVLTHMGIAEYSESFWQACIMLCAAMCCRG